jgi:hypothetical protein
MPQVPDLTDVIGNSGGTSGFSEFVRVM